LIVEKIDEEKASLYLWRTSTDLSWLAAPGWRRYEAIVSKWRGKYKLQFTDNWNKYDLTLKGEYLDIDSSLTSSRLKRVP
jgi:hypothetical protein